MKYYHREHLAGYRQMQEEGKTTWGGISYHAGTDDWDDFSSKAFLDGILPRLDLVPSESDVFEIGTGTGPVACYLARLGFRVDAVDLVEDAIKTARRHATELGLDISYDVTDACAIPKSGKRYDLIVDSYCLQGIVLDKDRQSVFRSVLSRLKDDGYYLISTSVGRSSLDRHDTPTEAADGAPLWLDPNGDLWDPQSGIYYKSFKWYQSLGDRPEDYEDAIEVQGTWYVPNRRVHSSESLAAEIRSHGFEILYQGGEEGEDLVCVKSGSDKALRRQTTQ